MTEIIRSALLPYPAQDMYVLINDVSAYPQFMRGCVGAEVIVSGEEMMEARLDLAAGRLKYSFTTHNQLYPPHKVEMTLVDGPFESFHGLWTVQTLSEEACKVTLDLQFTLSSRVLGVAAKKLFSPIANDLVDALVKRAHHLYQNP